MVKVPALTWAAGAHVSSHASGGRVNEADTRSVNTPDRATVTSGSLGVPGFSLSMEAALDGIMDVPGSFDISNVGNGKLGQPGYP
jgi:hypothetical protein